MEPFDNHLRRSVNDLAVRIVELQYACQNQVWKPYGPPGQEKSLRDAGYHLAYMAEALEADDPAHFTGGNAVECCIQVSEQEILISVQDEGPGIPPEQMSRLFQPFQRGRSGTGGEKSTGLGLTIVKRIVEGHGGKIWLESRVGAGTTFFVSIPFQSMEVSE